MNTDLRASWWRRVRNSWRRRSQRPGTVDVLTDGFLLARGRRKTDVRWNDVLQIDGGVQDTLSLDILFVVFRTPAGAVTVDELDDGFRTFEGAVFERWPAIRDRWVDLQCGPLHQPKYQTLWPR